MKHWIDGTSETRNVVVANDKGLLIGSVDEEHREEAGRRLEAGENAPAVLGTEGLMIVPFAQVRSLVVKSTDDEVELRYRTNGSVESETLRFEDADAAASFAEHIGPLLPATLAHEVHARSVVGAAAAPLASLAMALGASALFIDKFRLPVYLVGGLWAAYSCWRLVRRVKSPPVVTRWSVRGKHVGKAFRGVKLAFGYALAALFVVGLGLKIPDSHGERAVYDRYVHDVITPDVIPTLVARGGNPSYADADGDTPLGLSLYREEDEIALALIEAGADVNVDIEGYSALEYALYNDAGEGVIEALLERGALARAERDGFDSDEYLAHYIDSIDDGIGALLFRYRRTVRSSL